MIKLSLISISWIYFAWFKFIYLEERRYTQADKYKDEWYGFKEVIHTLPDIFMNGANLDANNDGFYGLDEMMDVLIQAKDDVVECLESAVEILEDILS